MSRYTEYDGDGEGPPPEFWQKRVDLALAGRRGKAALTELREALLALPEKRLIARALCTVGMAKAEPPKRLPKPTEAVATVRSSAEWQKWYSAEWAADQYESEQALVAEQGVGVCAMGAYLWYRKVKAGMDPEAAFESLPALADFDDSDDQLHRTAMLGKDAGMVFALAWEIGYTNDETLSHLTPEERYVKFLHQVDRWLALPLPVKPPPRVKRQRKVTIPPTPSGFVQEALL